MGIQENKIDKYIGWLLIISVIVRGFLAAFIEFGNDEVYYWTYAMYPDWSHFDHPAMVGWMMQIFSLNLLFDSEFALRLSSVIFMTVDTFIIYKLGCLIKGKLTGLYAALLYTASFYAFVITGILLFSQLVQSSRREGRRYAARRTLCRFGHALEIFCGIHMGGSRVVCAYV